MAGPGGVQPQVGALPPGAAAAAGMEDRLAELVALLHTPTVDGGDLESRAEALDIEAIIPQLPAQPPPQYGELPGEGYLYAHAPEVRQAALVESTPEGVRAWLLRAIEVCAANVQLPFGERGPNDWGRAALEFSQAYLLLDPSVDENGVPVGAQAKAQGEAQEGVARAQGEATIANTHAGAHAQAHVAQATAEANHVARFQHPVTALGHPMPPRVADNPAEEAIKDKHKNQEEVLRGARADRPRPQPRVGQ